MNIRRTRIVTGLVLFTYLTTHLINHSLGLISLDAMEAGRAWFLALWRNPLSTAVFYGSLLTHFILALYALYQRRHLRMPFWEALQLTLGLCIPLLLATHFVGTRMAYEWYGIEDMYAKTVLTLWRQSPIHGVRQASMVLIAWTHGCIGLYFWLRLRPWYPRYSATLYAFALLLPVFALLGFVQAGREIDYLIARNPDWINQLYQRTNVLRPGQGEDLVILRDGIIYGFWACLGAVLAARAARHAFERRRRVQISYPDGRQVQAPRGFTVLEASRFARIPHASVCGGRGRCSTCRIRIIKGLESVPMPSPAELKVLARIGAPANVRLACQLHPTRDISIVPLLPADANASDGFVKPSYLAGQECDMTVLFADLRSFTTIAERKLPYDVVFILNRYAEIVGTAIERAGGIPNQFTGDGLMALFGVQTGPEQGCQSALTAAREIVSSVAQLSEMLSEELDAALKVGIGIHTGPSVVGQMGYGMGTYLTAVGDTVNVASRLQELTKEYDCALIISEQVTQRAGIEMQSSPRHQVSVRNRREPLVVYAISDESRLLSASIAPKSQRNTSEATK
jgi:adenylate cyclase